MIWFLAKSVILCMYHPPVLSVEGCEEETLNSTIQLFSHREAEAYPIKNGITNVTLFWITHQSTHLYASESFRASRSRFRNDDFFGTFLLRFNSKSISWLVWGIYFLYISPHWTPNHLRIWNLKLCPHLMIAVLRDEFPHSQVCQLSDQVIALSIVHWEHPRLCSVGMGCWFQEVCWKRFAAYLVETLTVSWSRPAFFWMSVTSVHLTITFIVEMRNEKDGGLQTY